MRKAGWFVLIRTFVARRASVWTTRSRPVVTTLREAHHARRVTSVCAAAVQQKRQSAGVIGSQLRRAAKFVSEFPEILVGLILATQLSCDSWGKAEQWGGC